ncbi:MAG: polymer-forming cytoskeletal protein [Thermodesulfobacteriota bacterium]
MLNMRKMMKQEEAPEPKSVSSQIPAVPAAEPVDGKTVISEKISIEGDIRGQENLVIEGSMKGKIELENHQVKVGPKGRVEGQIVSENAIISGHFIGNIYAAGKVKITKEANFSGEIKAKSISVEDGAYLKAIIELEREVKKVIPAIGKAASEPEKDPVKHQMAAGKKN